MAFEHMNRSQRRAAAAYAREAAAKRPVRLTELSQDRIRESYPNPAHAPTHVWESRKYLVQLFDEEPYLGLSHSTPARSGQVPAQRQASDVRRRD